MRKTFVFAICIAAALAACPVNAQESEEAGGQTASVRTDLDEEEESEETADTADWPCDASYEDEDGNFLYVSWLEMDDEKGWYVGCMIGDDSYGGMLEQDGDILTGTLTDAEGLEHSAAVSEEEDGAKLELDKDEAFHFTVMETEETGITVMLNTEGIGEVAYAQTEQELEEGEYYNSVQITVDEGETCLFGAKTEEPGWSFTKWTKDGEDYSTDPVITVEPTDMAVFVAVFDYSE